MQSLCQCLLFLYLNFGGKYYSLTVANNIEHHSSNRLVSKNNVSLISLNQYHLYVYSLNYPMK